MDWFDDIFGRIDYTLDDRHKIIREKAHRRTWLTFFVQLFNIAYDRYHFKNLDDTIDERVLKLSLLYYASVCFFDRIGGNIMALPGGAGTNGVTVYGDFTHCYVYGRNGYNEEIPLYVRGADELPLLAEAYVGINFEKPRGVWFRENPQKFPFIEEIIKYADALTDTWEKLEVARRNAAVPFVIVTDEQGAINVRNNLKTRDANEAALIISSGIYDPTRVVVQPIQTSGEAIKYFTDLMGWYLQQYYALCGINCDMNPDKMAQQTDDEINVNNQSIDSTANGLIEYIKAGLEEVNKHFGKNYQIERGPGGDSNGQPNIYRLDRNTGPLALEA